jgi:fibronectin type III domain
VISHYAVYWQEVNKNNTKSSVTVPKNRNIIYYRWPESSPQYKITGLEEFIPFKVWVTAFTVKGEGMSTSMVTGIPTHQGNDVS